MQQTIYASFDNVDTAKKAIGALIQGGVPVGDITLACKHLTNQVQAIDMDAVREVGSPRGEESAIPSESAREFGAMTGVAPGLRVPGPGRSYGDLGMSGQGTQIAEIAATANATNDPGHMTDLLWGLLPSDMADMYQADYEDGKTVVILRDPAPEAIAILREQGAITLNHHGYVA